MIIRMIRIVLMICLLATAPVFGAMADDMRTAGRTVEDDRACFPDCYEMQPPHKSISFDQPSQWRGLSWDSAVWQANRTGWSTERVIKNLFKNGYFRTHYISHGRPTLEVGKAFFDLSEIDRLRTLRLMSEHTGILDRYKSFDVVLFPQGALLGRYSKAGLTTY